jgi:hypothetical protein
MTAIPALPGIPAPGDAPEICAACGYCVRRSLKDPAKFQRHECVWEMPFWVKTLDERAQMRADAAGDILAFDRRYVRPLPEKMI